MEVGSLGLFGVPETRTETIEDLLKRILVTKQWRLYLPSFQRSFVWDESDIKEFIESIIKGYPTGMFIFWKALESGADEPADPFRIPLIDVEGSGVRGSAGAEEYYVIDGQQRLTSLLMLACGWSFSRNGKVLRRTPISYNVANGRLYVGRRGVDLYRGIRDFLYNDDGERETLKRELGSDGYRKFSEVIRRILRHKIPVCIVTTVADEDRQRVLEEITEVFIRTNRSGQRISNIELLQSYTAGMLDGRLVRQIRDFYDEIQKNYAEEVDMNVYLRFIFSVLGLKQSDIEDYRRFRREVVRRRSQKTIDGDYVVEGANRAFTQTIKLVTSLFGKAVIDVMPSQLPLIPVATYIYVKNVRRIDEIREEDKVAIKKWLMLVNFNMYYSTRRAQRLQKDIELVKKRPDSFPYEELLDQIEKLDQRKWPATKIWEEKLFDGRTADILRRPGKPYLFILYTLLADSGATDLTGTQIKHRTMNDLAKHHIFPREIMREYHKLPKTAPLHERIPGINGLGNITFIHHDINSEISSEKPETYLNNYDKTELEKHFIPTDKNLWTLDKFEDFTEKRITMMYEYLKKRYPDIVE